MGIEVLKKLEQKESEKMHSIKNKITAIWDENLEDKLPTEEIQLQEAYGLNLVIEENRILNFKYQGTLVPTCLLASRGIFKDHGVEGIKEYFANLDLFEKELDKIITRREETYKQLEQLL